MRAAIDPGNGVATFDIISGTVEVSEDGRTFIATYTVEFSEEADDDRTVPFGQLGPVTVTAERITVEPMGEPVAPLPTNQELSSPSPRVG